MPARSAVSLTARTQKSPRGAGLGVRIGASTLELETFRAGDFRNVVEEEPTVQHDHYGARLCVCHPSPPPDRAHLTYFMGGVA